MADDILTLLGVCNRLLEVKQITSHPAKFRFAKEHGLEGDTGHQTLDNVHAYMSKCNYEFASVVKEYTEKYIEQA